MLSTEGAAAVEGGLLIAPQPPPVDPAKAAAEAEAEAAKFAHLEALRNMNVVRRWCIKISTHEDFEFVVFILIFINIVTLAMYNPLKSDESGYNFYLDRIRKSLTLQIQLSSAVQSSKTWLLPNSWSCLLAYFYCFSSNDPD